MTDRRLRLAMIGGGPGSMIGPIHRIAARIDDRYELVAGAMSSNPERAHLAAAECRIAPDRSYADWRTLIAAEAKRPAQDKIDVIAVVTPNHLHAGPVIAALDSGFHVICDKPLAGNFGEALAIQKAAGDADGLFALTYCYSGYPMVRQMKAIVASGALGQLRIVNVQYAQAWLTLPLEAEGNRQAEWRTDPARSGAGGAVGDIGTHAIHLAQFVAGVPVESLCADLSSFGPGRRLDDNANILLRYRGGAKGILWASQVAPGKGNQLRIGLWGDQGGIEWDQENPNSLRFTPTGKPTMILERGGADGGFGGYATRLPSHHPEGYLEAFAQIYTDFAELVMAKAEARAPTIDAQLVPGIAEGLDGMRFISGAVASHSKGQWLAREDWCGL